jgi:KDO2-lipid IV(A) lauroyltransferase
MICIMFKLLLKPLTLLSLPALHRIGTLIGYIMYALMPESKKNIKENIRQSGLLASNQDINSFIKSNLLESGKSYLESLAIWQKKDNTTLKWVKQCKNWHLAEEALSKKKGIIFLTPHMGCFEITSKFYGAQRPITVLFRRPKMRWLHALTESGRTNQNINLAPANMLGVRLLIQALKRGEAIGILPDQIPGKGEGEWAPFFGKPAYTMSLASKLAEKTGAAVIMAFGERLPNGEGFNIHLTQLENGSIATPTLLNKAIEHQIKQNPSQYLWAYPRYKVRARLLKKQATEL